VEALDVVEDVGTGVPHGQVSASVDALTLEYAKEAFGRSVVASVADRAHTARELVFLEELLVLVGRELRPAIQA